MTENQNNNINMAASSKSKDKALNSPPSSAGRPPQAVKFTRRTASGRIMSLSRDDDMDTSNDFSGQNDYINYTVMMPPTPDNQPAGSSSDNKPDGPGSHTTSRFGSESRMGRQIGEEEDNYSNNGDGGGTRRMTIMKSNSKSMLLRSQTQDFDHNRWLFETKGTYGVGNAYWSEGESYGPDTGLSMSDFMDKPWKPLTRKIPVPAAVLSPYRYTCMCFNLQ